MVTRVIVKKFRGRKEDDGRLMKGIARGVEEEGGGIGKGGEAVREGGEGVWRDKGSVWPRL